ncbi:PTS sugar transporter subunit IIA [Thermoanaerobacterium sp. DL9XJH110]|uniref:PTS sugar transporter subunit IIA n=1 Tax=Thermoanaerobacterium sp. DL9XJH110 TaxID=3386643 RepID=UPI003BB78084
MDKDLIVLNLKAESRSDVISQLGNLMKKKGYVKETYKDAVLKREEKYPTGLPSEGIYVAIPHTDGSHVNNSAIAVATLKTPVVFKMMGNPENEVNVEIVIMLAIKNPDDQIQLLKKLMSVFQNRELLLKLKTSRNREEVVDLLRFLDE